MGGSLWYISHNAIRTFFFSPPPIKNQHVLCEGNLSIFYRIDKGGGGGFVVYIIVLYCIVLYFMYAGTMEFDEI